MICGASSEGTHERVTLPLLGKDALHEDWRIAEAAAASHLDHTLLVLEEPQRYSADKKKGSDFLLDESVPGQVRRRRRGGGGGGGEERLRSSPVPEFVGAKRITLPENPT